MPKMGSLEKVTCVQADFRFRTASQFQVEPSRLREASELKILNRHKPHSNHRELKKQSFDCVDTGQHNEGAGLSNTKQNR
jgi:hypothetical protein